MCFSISSQHYEVSVSDFIINPTTNSHLATSSSFQLQKLLSLEYKTMIIGFDDSKKGLQISVES